MKAIVTYKAAVAENLARYFTGKSCKNGHIAERYTKRRDCVKCRGELVKKWRKENQKKYLSGNKRWATENPERVRVSSTYSRALGRARQIGAVPSWVDLKQIKKIYANCPKGMQVDHIWPLNGGGEWMGLHVPWNLQYLSQFENKSKGNKAPC